MFVYTREAHPGEHVGHHDTEQFEFRHVDREMFYERLRLNGQRSYDEFRHAEDIWSARQD